ncbi:hypothetical protein AAHB54_09370 [Bacillus cereus]
MKHTIFKYAVIGITDWRSGTKNAKAFHDKMRKTRNLACSLEG